MTVNETKYTIRRIYNANTKLWSIDVNELDDLLVCLSDEEQASTTDDELVKLYHETKESFPD